MEPPTVDVDEDAFRLAFDMVSSGLPFENEAYVSLENGTIFWKLGGGDVTGIDKLPDDFDDNPDGYIAVPHKRDLDLGNRLVFDFVEREMPAQARAVSAIFSKRGAYARFKDLLDRKGALQRWYDFEERATTEALLAWCEENGIRLVPAKP